MDPYKQKLEKMMARFDEIWGDLPKKIDQYTKVSTHVENQSHCKATVTLVLDKEDLPQLSFNGGADCFLYAQEEVAYEALCRLRHHFKDRLNSTVYHYHPKYGGDFWMNGCVNTWDEVSQTIVHMRRCCMLSITSILSTRIKRLFRSMPNRRRLLGYRISEGHQCKLVLHHERIFELEDELRKLKGEPSSDEDENVKPTRDAKRLCTGVLSLKINPCKNESHEKPASPRKY
uniref:Uncharacterized protein n=1 Tax=Oryza punctata TaxID=4537 RepID=A0A0E0LTH2_ORYPU